MRHAHTPLPATDDYTGMRRVAAMLAGYASEGGKMPRGNPEVEEAIRQMGKLGVSFDGHKYRYRGYGYDLLVDAVSYALSDRARSKREAASGGVTEWLEAEEPTDAERRLMEELGIAFDGQCYRYAAYRYDSFADALNYARLKHAAAG